MNVPFISSLAKNLVILFCTGHVCFLCVSAHVHSLYVGCTCAWLVGNNITLRNKAASYCLWSLSMVLCVCMRVCVRVCVCCLSSIFDPIQFYLGNKCLIYICLILRS